jgi:hypothetical protein
MKYTALHITGLYALRGYAHMLPLVARRKQPERYAKLALKLLKNKNIVDKT